MALVSSAAVTAYARRYFDAKKVARTRDPAFLQVTNNMCVLVTLGVLFHVCGREVHWPLPWLAGKAMETVCTSAICVAAAIELGLVLRSDASNKWDRNVFILVEGEVALGEDDLPADAKDEEESVCGLDEKAPCVLDEKSAIVVEDLHSSAPHPDLVVPQVSLPILPKPAILSDAPGAKRSS